MRICLFLALRALCAVIHPFSGQLAICSIRYSGFALATAGLITHGGIYTCLGVIFIRYILAGLTVVMQVCPPFSISFGRTTISDEHSFVPMLYSGLHVFYF